MTKQDLQKGKPGTKPSTTKKLKRSKSADDIPIAKSTITQLQQHVQFHAETAQNYLKSLQISQARVSELETQLKNNPPTLTELDSSLFARHKNLKDWFTQYSKNKQLDKELEENIDEASSELKKQDNLLSNLRLENRKLKQQKESLQKDLNLTTKLAEMRKVPFPEYENNWTYLKYALYSLLAVGFTLWLTNNLKNQENK